MNATPRTTLRAAAALAATCPCGHSATLDLAALIAAGHGDTPLPALRLVCRACGGLEVRGVSAGRGWRGIRGGVGQAL